MESIAFFNKWLHLMSVISLLGGTVMIVWVVLPALSGQADSELRRKYGIALMILWSIILATGFLNYYIVSPSVGKSYHMLLGMKIGLAFVMLAVSMIYAHPMPMFANLRENKGASILAIVILLGVIIVGISAHLNISRIRPPKDSWVYYQQSR